MDPRRSGQLPADPSGSHGRPSGEDFQPNEKINKTGRREPPLVVSRVKRVLNGPVYQHSRGGGRAHGVESTRMTGRNVNQPANGGSTSPIYLLTSSPGASTLPEPRLPSPLHMNGPVTEDVKIKQERSVSPPLQSIPRLVTSGSRFVTPVPLACTKGQMNYIEERKKWARKELLILKRLGIKHEKIFVRDDGMVIDWVSNIPLWSDTLLPEGRNTESTASLVPDVLIRHSIPNPSLSPRESKPTTAPSDHKCSADVIDIPTNSPREEEQIQRKRRQRSSSEVNPRRLKKSFSNSEPSGSSQVESDVELNVPSGPCRVDPVTVDETAALPDSGFTPTRHVTPNLRPSEVTEEIDNATVIQIEALHREMEALEDSALDFFQQFVSAFDSDRASLASAYSRNATFSIRIHDIIPPKSLGAAFLPTSEAERFASRKDSRNLLRKAEGHLWTNRAEIVTGLLTLGPHQFCPASDPADVEYSVAYLAAHSSVLLVCHSHLTDVERNCRLSVDQTFLLRKKEDDEEDRITSGLWPLVVVSHQLAVRDLRLASALPTATV